MNCPKCNAQIPDNSKFCMSCGTPFAAGNPFVAAGDFSGGSEASRTQQSASSQLRISMPSSARKSDPSQPPSVSANSPHTAGAPVSYSAPAPQTKTQAYPGMTYNTYPQNAPVSQYPIQAPPAAPAPQKSKGSKAALWISIVAGLLIVSLVGLYFFLDDRENSKSSGSSANSHVSSDADSPDTDSSDTDSSDRLLFTTTDIDGDTVTLDDLTSSNTKVIMLNFWEPWCGPCVGEMPELQHLYEAYRDQGLLIVGVFSSTDMIDDARAVLDDAGVTYPIICYTDAFEDFETGYVPTTVFLDGMGHVISDDPVIGAQSYEEWEYIILDYLD